MKSKDFYKTAAWKYCSKYVLLYYSNDEGYVQCSTSGEWMACNNRNMQCGHYFKANEHKSVALEFKNLAPQCYQDNRFFSGKPEIMSKWIEKTHGEGTVQWLTIKKNNICKLDKYELDLFRTIYKKLFDDLVKQKGFNPWKK